MLETEATVKDWRLEIERRIECLKDTLDEIGIGYPMLSALGHGALFELESLLDPGATPVIELIAVHRKKHEECGWCAANLEQYMKLLHAESNCTESPGGHGDV